ncbi:MAG: hypothetical protein H7829_13060 [Magnetococcus sp. THC-1_WYH]
MMMAVAGLSILNGGNAVTGPFFAAWVLDQQPTRQQIGDIPMGGIDRAFAQGSLFLGGAFAFESIHESVYDFPAI